MAAINLIPRLEGRDPSEVLRDIIPQFDFLSSPCVCVLFTNYGAFKHSLKDLLWRVWIFFLIL